jgi:hypothetical protein
MLTHAIAANVSIRSDVRNQAFIDKPAFYVLALGKAFVHSPANEANPPKGGDAKPPI